MVGDGIVELQKTVMRLVLAREGNTGYDGCAQACAVLHGYQVANKVDCLGRF